MEKRTKIIIGVSVAVLLGIIVFLIYWFTKSTDQESSESSGTSKVGARNIVATCPDTKFTLLPSEPVYAITCSDDPSKIIQFECTDDKLKVDESGGKSVFYCEEDENVECESGKKEVGKFDCKGSVSASQDGDNYSAKCDGKEIKFPELHSCQNFDVSCLNGKCKVCCDNVASATCPAGTKTFYKGKCNDQKISACNELGCSFTCNGKTVKIPDTTIKSLEKTCINGECVICGKNIQPEKPTCVYGRELFSGVCEKIMGACRDGKCSVLCDMRVAAKGSTELNFSCLDKNCVVCG